MTSITLPRKERVLILCTASSIGGTEKVVADHSRILAEAGCAVKTRIAVSDRSKETIKWFAKLGVPAKADPRLLDVHVSRTMADMRPLSDLVSEIRPDIVIIHYGVNHISLKDIAAIRRSGIKHVFAACHHPTPLDQMPARTHKMTKLASIFCEGILLATDVLTKQLLSIGVQQKKIRRIPYFVPKPVNMISRSEARKAWGLSDSDFVVSCLSRIELEKGIRELIEGCELALKQVHNLKLVVGGSGGFFSAMSAVARQKLGDLAIMPGRIEDPDLLYAASDVFCLPSYLEGFGLVYREAAHFGVPSIGTNVGGIPEAIIDNKTGIIIPARDSAAVSMALIQLAENPDLRQSLGAAARLRVETDNSDAAASEKLLQALFS